MELLNRSTSTTTSQSPDLGHPLPVLDQLSTHHTAADVLSKIAREEVPAIILIGGSRAEFNHIQSLLKESKDSRSAFYECCSENEVGEIPDRSSTVFAARTNSGTFDVIKLGEILHCLDRPAIRGRLIFVGSPDNLPFAFEAVKSQLPHFPVGALIVGSDYRLSSKSLFSIPSLDKGLFCTLPSQLGDHKLLEAISDISTTSRSKSALSAAKLLQPVELHDTGYPVPHAVYSCLEKVLIPQSAQESLPILLRGGCGIVTFMPKARPISPDIDFTSLLSVQHFTKFIDLMRKVAQGGEFEVRGCPLSTNSSRSTYVKGKVVVVDHQAEVSLDAVAVRRVFDVFAYEFKYDKVVHRYHHIAKLDSGNEIGVVAPELTLVEKLVAGRGKELDKFDILDATGILANQELELCLIQRIIERQRFDSRIDSVNALTPLTEDFGSELFRMGVLRGADLLAIIKRKVNEQLNADGNEDSQITRERKIARILTPHVLKRIGLVNKLLMGLYKVLAEKDLVDNRLTPAASPEELWSRDKIISGVHNLEQFLYSYVEHQLFKRDVYVHRNSRSYDRATESGFWEKKGNFYKIQTPVEA